ncbi:hypothetical protein [Sphingomonas melonis]|uniref:hypothetical protein n=1 Tax=Sphingomonas melonis TaxID=152682 RepID=UPI0035C85FC7
MGGLFSGSKTTTQNQQTDSGPSKFQQPFLQGAFDAAQKEFQGKQGTPFYQGNLYAGMSDSAKASLESLKGYAAGQGLSAAGSLTKLGSGMAGYGDKAGATLDQYLATASEDPTKANMAAASEYAANPYVDGMIDANSRDVVRNLNESTLPTLNRTASATGNINSSRAGVAEGIARRGAEDRVADISASIRGDAYNRGLSLASQDRTQKLNAMGTAAQGYQGLAQTGIGALQAGTGAAYDAYKQIAGADALDQADRQGQADADYKAWQGNDTRGSDLLQRYYGIIGGNSWGSSGSTVGTTIQKENPSLFNSILGGASTVAAFL